jgi:hypothetical protein
MSGCTTVVTDDGIVDLLLPSRLLLTFGNFVAPDFAPPPPAPDLVVPWPVVDTMRVLVGAILLILLLT